MTQDSIVKLSQPGGRLLLGRAGVAVNASWPSRATYGATVGSSVFTTGLPAATASSRTS